MTIPISPVAFIGPSGDTSGVTDTAAYNIAAGEIAAAGTGGIVQFGAGHFWLSGNSAPITRSGLYVQGSGMGATLISAVGAGDVFRMYDGHTYTTRTLNGGGFRHMTIDGTSTTGNSAGIHLGDILQAEIDHVAVQNFTAGTTSKGIWLDNQYYWTEQLYAWVYGAANTTSVFFDNSTGTTVGANATGSFDRAVFYAFVKQGGVGDAVSFNNGAFLNDGQLDIRGNFLQGSAAHAALRLTGSNGGGYSGMSGSILNMGCELPSGSGTAPTTIIFGSGSNFITACTGIMDFSLGAASFTAAGASLPFAYAGSIRGDATLYSYPQVGSPSFTQAVTANGQTIYTTYFPVTRATNGGTGYTGLILQAGVADSQSCVIRNVGSGSLTFAASGTSNVATGTSAVIPGNTGAVFSWDATGSLWYMTSVGV